MDTREDSDINADAQCTLKVGLRDPPYAACFGFGELRHDIPFQVIAEIVPTCVA